MSSTHTPGDETPDDDEIFPFIVDADTDRGQHIFCQNLLVNLFEPGISPCKTEFPDVKIKRQINQVQANPETTSDPPRY